MNETIADIVFAMRNEGHTGEASCLDWIRTKMTYYADRIEAAAKREREAGAEAAQICGEIGEAIGRGSSGNAARMREAMKQIYDRVNSLDEDCAVDPIDIRDIARAALASPPRNCDMPLVVDGPADNNADKAWLVFKRQNPDAYFDVSGLLRCIDWLLAPATEKEGGEK